MKKKLNHKQEEFLRLYRMGVNIGEAYWQVYRCKWGSACASGSRLLRKLRSEFGLRELYEEEELS